MPPHYAEVKLEAGYVAGYDWYIRSSVVNALWGQVMGRLAAKVWLSELGLDGLPEEQRLRFPPKSAVPEPLWPKGIPPSDCGERGLCAYKIENDALAEFWTALAEIAFPKDEYGPDNEDEQKRLWSEGGFRMPPEDIGGLDPDQRQILLVLRYFEPRAYGANQRRMRLRVIRAEAYDFVLHDGGLDLFVPPNPFVQLKSAPPAEPAEGGPSSESEENDWKTRHEILRMYKFRQTGPPPIGLSGVPASSPHADKSYLVPMTSAPPGPTDIPHDWMRAMAANATWWITGSIYAAMNQALPRLVASLWFEEHVDPSVPGAPRPLSYMARWQDGDGLRELIQHRLEARLNCEIQLGNPGQALAASSGWNPRDVMITNEGLVVPYPGTGPNVKTLLTDIMAGTAGNPVFTNTIPNRPGE